MVCSLAKSWQNWVAENEEKQASEPSGWTPSDDKNEKSSKTHPRAQDKRGTSKLTVDSEKELLNSKIRSKKVVKTVTSKVQEKGVGIGFLTNRYHKEADEVDKILREKMSPTRRRKCSNLVSELTKGWKEMEKEKKDVTVELEENRINSMDSEDSGFSEGNDKIQERAENTEIQEELVEVSCVKIKRPSTTVINKDVDEVKKINILAKKYSPVGNLKSKWHDWAEEHTVNQKLNPFSEEFDYNLSMSSRLHKGDEGYGRPKEGTKTAERAKRAEQHIHREISDMCYIIRTMVDPGPDGKTRVTFGELFDRYVRISDKVVGILMRARKHGKVHFEGEMLWQGRDDHVVITLLV
ncbi:ABRA protein, partial [Amia calva]|nr:ABRA protein [Amia calva]